MEPFSINLLINGTKGSNGTSYVCVALGKTLSATRFLIDLDYLEMRLPPTEFRLFFACVDAKLILYFVEVKKTQYSHTFSYNIM